MKFQFKKCFILLLFILIVSGLIESKQCYAASAKVELTCDKSTVTLGDFVYAYISIDSQTTFTDFVANLEYDSNVLEYVNGAKVVTGGNGLLKVSDMDNLTGTIKRKYALKFKTVKVGKSKLTLEDTMVYDESGNELSVSSNEMNISVKAKVTASTNANLKSLSTDPEMKPSFKKSIHDYSVTVDNKTDQLFIVANPEDKKATVSISGNDSLQEGENKVVITVLAESGNVIEYTIKVLKEKTPESTIAPTPTVEAVAPSNTTKIVNDGTDLYLVINGNYKLLEVGDDVEIPAGYMKSEITISGEAITAYIPDGDIQSDFSLIYVENSDGEQGFYQYDRVEKTLQRFIDNSGENTTSDKDEKQLEQYRSNLNKAAIVIACLSALSVLLMVTTFRLAKRKKRRRR